MRRIIIVCAFSFALSLLCSPSLFAQEESWSLIGSWINKAYDYPGAFSAKIVYSADGNLTMYKFLKDSNESDKSSFAIEENWTEKGVHWFKVKLSMANGTTWYEIDKLTEGGNKYESVFCRDKYPLNFDPNSPAHYYSVRYRE